MKKSKLELYEDVLKILSDKPLPLDTIAFEGNMDCTLLRKRLDFLIANELVEERAYEKNTLYALTNRGAAICKTFMLTKRLEKLQATIKNVDKEVQAVQTIQETAWKAKRKL
jgi:predicted transcriptional regulator